jgi:hypothetical protein
MDTSEWIALVSSVVAVVALVFTGLQVRLAKRQTELQQQQREDAAQPYVWVDLRPDDQHLHLMRLLVCNEGPTVAKNVVVRFDPPLPREIGSSEAQADYRIVGMPPGRRMSWSLNTSPDWIQGDLAKRFTVTIDALGPFGPVQKLVYELDIDEYRQVNASPPGTLYGVGKAIKDLTKVLKERRER